MEELLLNEIRVGQTVKGTVISVKDNVAVVDLHQFTEGTIYINEYDPQAQSFAGLLKVGDELEAVVKKVDEERGKILLSRLPLLKDARDKEMEEYSHSHKVISVKIEKNNGFGLVASYLGNQVFVPTSEVDLDKDFDINQLVGKTIEVRLRDFDDRRKRYVASRKELQLEEARKVRQAELDNIKEGDVLEGTVEKIDEHLGVFVRFNHNQGLIRYRELAHVRFAKMADVVSVGEKLQVKVIAVNGNKIDLSRKALLETPFAQYVKDHKVSDIVEGEVVQKLAFGAIVNVADNVTALLHKNEISWNPNDNSFNYLKIGSPVKAAIISIDKKREKISLSMKTLVDNPWAKVDANVGDTVECEITAIIPGKMIEVSAFGVTGTIDINEVTMEEKSSKLEDYYAVGDKIKAIVTFVDTRAWKLELSNKRYTSRVARQNFEEYMQKEQENDVKVTIGDLYQLDSFLPKEEKAEPKAEKKTRKTKKTEE